MSTKRENIFSNITTVLNGVSSIKYVEADRLTPVDIDVVPFPCAFIYQFKEDKVINDINKTVGSVIGQETWEFQIVIEVWTKNNDLESILNDIHTVLCADYTRGSNAIYTERMGTEFFVVDLNSGLRGMNIFYSIYYRHPRGAM